ncbi:hypothetical protein PPYR_07307 [Photinus pyralis]|uniref:Uncharacterized protein n=2 Tax=Photinus pyralis TaxID=7054 RepID=A0A5N4AQ22_PHOPY|nr:uncharacterized protein LOC116168653 [Photinus pyralis]XP_031340449.1 uncharacterized protein LOC116168653 [Photinus pyralis]KAB0799427.1 hypothetical protein PPYR_07307 [Photinus pyralis]
MPELEQQPSTEITSPRSSLSVTPFILSPVSSGSSMSHESDSEVNYDWNPFPYGHIQIPLEPTIRDVLIHAANTSELHTVTKIQLQVISIDTSLQHMSVHLPLLRELILDGSAISSLRDLGYGLKNLKILKVCSCGLTTLDGMLGLDTVEEFHAESNQITDLSPCGFLPKIRLINLKRNLLKDVMAVTFLTICESLEHLTLSENIELIQAFDTPLYRKIVKSILPNLKTLDEVDISSEETLPEYAKLHQFCASEHLESDQEFDFNEETKDASRHLYSITDKGQFVVSFTPKVLSPRSPSGHSSTDSTIISAFREEKFPSFEEWLHTPDSDD